MKALCDGALGPTLRGVAVGLPGSQGMVCWKLNLTSAGIHPLPNPGLSSFFPFLVSLDLEGPRQQTAGC